MTIFASIIAILSILPYCYYASRIQLKIQLTADAAFESTWYDLPVVLQHNILHIITFAQLRRTVSGYGLFNCDLEGFTTVRKLNFTNLLF